MDNFLSVSWYPIYPADAGGKVRNYYIMKNMSKFHPYLISPSPTPPDIDSFIVDPLLPFGRLKTKINPQIFNYFDPTTTIRINKLAKKLTPLVVQAETIWAFPSVFYSSTRNNTKMSLCIHNIEYITAKRMYGEKNVLTKVVYKLEQTFSRKADIVITVSMRDEAIVNKTYGVPKEKILVVPNGVDIPRFSKKAQNIKKQYGINGDLVLFVGKLDYGPNREALSLIVNKIMTRVLKDRPNTTFMVVGHPKPVIRKEKLVSAGCVEDVVPYLQSADVSIAPIYAGSGTRLKILEYIAAGAPVVSTSVGVEGLELKNDEEILIEDDTETFAKKLVYLLENEKERQKLIRNGRRAIEKYDWKEIVPSFEEQLLSILE